MQKRFKLFFSLLCLPLLFGCENDALSANDGNKFQLMMTLEHDPYFKADYNSYSGIGSRYTAEEIIERVDYGENVLFAFTKEDCPSCESFFKNAGKVIYDTNYRFAYISEDTKTAAEKISKYAIDNNLDRVLAHPISGATPSLYVMSKERIVELTYGSKNDDSKIVSVAFNEYLAKSNILYSGLFRWITLYRTMSGSSLLGNTYVLSKGKESEFYTNVYPRALASGKPLRVLNIGAYPKDSTEMQELYEYAATEDIEGKILDVHNVTTEEGDIEKAITVIDDVESFMEENY